MEMKRVMTDLSCDDDSGYDVVVIAAVVVIVVVVVMMMMICLLLLLFVVVVVVNVNGELGDESGVRNEKNVGIMPVSTTSEIGGEGANYYYY